MRKIQVQISYFIQAAAGLSDQRFSYTRRWYVQIDMARLSSHPSRNEWYVPELPCFCTSEKSADYEFILARMPMLSQLHRTPKIMEKPIKIWIRVMCQWLPTVKRFALKIHPMPKTHFANRTATSIHLLQAKCNFLNKFHKIYIASFRFNIAFIGMTSIHSIQFETRLSTIMLRNWSW